MATNNQSFTMDPKAAAAKIQAMNSSFTSLVQAVNNMVQDLTDLQTNFYSPAEKDSTLIYEECNKNLGTSGDASVGLYPAIKAAHQWCSAVDQYVQDKEYKASNGNPYDD